MHRHWLVVLALAALLALGVAACGGGGKDERQPRVQPPTGQQGLQRLGEAEGRLRLVARAGQVQDWVGGFEARTGCQVDVTVARSADEVAARIADGRHDAALVPGEVSLRLVADGAVAPVNTRLLRSYPDLFDGLKDLDATTVERRVYGVPQGRGANLLMWRKDRLPGSLRSSGAVFDPPQASAYRGWIAMRDDPTTIADAALWVGRDRKELEIEDPYALDDRQFRAAVGVLEAQRETVGLWWRDVRDAQTAFANADAIVGFSRQSVQVRLTGRPEPVPVESLVPREGATGWAEAWMVAARARHPSCAYRWIDHVTSPEVNARVAETLGQAPANRRSCELERLEDHCAAHRADDESYWEDVRFATTPTADCGDDRGRVCKDWAAWTAAWERLRR